MATILREDQTIRRWNTTNWQSEVLTGHTGWVVGLATDESVVASSSFDSTVRLWDPVTGAQRAQLTGHTGWIGAVAVVPRVSEEAAIFSAGDDATVRRWDPAEATAGKRTPPAHAGAMTAVALAGPLVVSGGEDAAIRWWRANDGTPVAEAYLEEPATVRALTAVTLPDGRTIVASGGEHENLVRWDGETGRPLGRSSRGARGLDQCDL